MYKLRTMKQNAEKSGPVLAKENDSRVTKIGRILRRYRIDEIPQFVNVIKGDMSLIGPRPERLFYIHSIREELPEFTLRLNEIGDLLNEVPKYEEVRIQAIRDRMKKGLEELDKGHDENRFEQEMIFYIEKLDVAEEKMRLSNHLTYFEETMHLNESGKKLGFIGQEIGREINTLGSKSNHAEMQKLVIGMKDNLEKIKEQILNTL
jgi:hypothetical protein